MDGYYYFLENRRLKSKREGSSAPAPERKRSFFGPTMEISRYGKENVNTPLLVFRGKRSPVSLRVKSSPSDSGKEKGRRTLLREGGGKKPKHADCCSSKELPLVRRQKRTARKRKRKRGRGKGFH